MTRREAESVEDALRRLLDAVDGIYDLTLKSGWSIRTEEAAQWFLFLQQRAREARETLECRRRV